MAFSTLLKALSMKISLFVMLMPCLLRALSSKGLDQSPLPSNFLFGTASSSYQYEGAYLSDGKGLNNWDVFVHKTPDKITDGSNGDVAVDQYHRYLEDIDLLEAINVNSYRFSISWARILPKGRFGEVNLAGVNYYNRLIDALLSKDGTPKEMEHNYTFLAFLSDAFEFCQLNKLTGIRPFVTLYHYDIPQELEDRYGSWLSPKMRDDYQHYADLCFKYFGDRVKYWVTFNEPDYLATYSYRTGLGPPCRCSKPFGNCSEGDSEKEPFVVAHNVILSHAAVVDIYRTKYQTEQGGRIGIVMHADWFEPSSNSTEDKLATERARAFNLLWFLDPVIFGKYPTEMQEILGNILPKFSSSEQEKLKGGLDFIGINHYESYYVKDCMFSVCEPGTGVTKTEGSYHTFPLGKPTSLDWQHVNPQGMENIVTYVKDRYNNIPMIITENGYGDLDNPNATEDQYLNDFNRIDYMSDHLDALLEAIRKGADVRGYFVWSLLDNFEWLRGYTIRYGLHHVDHSTLKRTPRLSANWYKEFIAKHETQALYEE